MSDAAVEAVLDKVFQYVDVRALVAGYESACAHGDWTFARELKGRMPLFTLDGCDQQGHR